MRVCIVPKYLIQTLVHPRKVTLMGAPAAVASARKQIRELLPISMAFLVENEDFANATMPSRFPSTDHNAPLPELRPQIRVQLAVREYNIQP